jgi:hypothetical protein
MLSKMQGARWMSSHASSVRGKRFSSVSTVVSYTKGLSCPQTKTSNGLRSGDRAGHTMSPLILTFCYISLPAVIHSKSFSGHAFLWTSLLVVLCTTVQFWRYNFETRLFVHVVYTLNRNWNITVMNNSAIGSEDGCMSLCQRISCCGVEGLIWSLTHWSTNFILVHSVWE